MLNSSLPIRLVKRFGEDAGPGYINYPIPVPAQTPTPTSAPASLSEGFPPITFTDPGAGGLPPRGADVNGILAMVSDWCRWQAAGGASFYDSAFSTAVNGYPKYAVLASTTAGIFWQSTVDNNTTDPDGGGAANWIQVGPAKASLSEVQAGTNDTKFVTPATLASAGNDIISSQNLASAGFRIHASGFIEQWGSGSIAGNTEQFFSFNTICTTWANVVCSGGTHATQQNNGPKVTGVLTTGFYVSNREGGFAPFWWQAYGV